MLPMDALAKLGILINKYYKLYKYYINKRIASQIIILSDPFLDIYFLYI